MCEKKIEIDERDVKEKKNFIYRVRIGFREAWLFTTLYYFLGSFEVWLKIIFIQDGWIPFSLANASVRSVVKDLFKAISMLGLLKNDSY